MDQFLDTFTTALAEAIHYALSTPAWSGSLILAAVVLLSARSSVWKARARQGRTMMTLATATELGLSTGIQAASRCPGCGHSYGKHLMTVRMDRHPLDQVLRTWCPVSDCPCLAEMVPHVPGQEPPSRPGWERLEALHTPDTPGDRYDPER